MPENKIDFEALVARLQHADQAVRIEAAALLIMAGEDGFAAVPALITLVQSGSLADRKVACWVLSELGPPAQAAVPALIEAAQDEDEDLSDLAIAALESIDVVDISPPDIKNAA